MNSTQNKKITFSHQIIILGFGSIGRALIPLIFEKFAIDPSQITIIASDDAGIKIAEQFHIKFQLSHITADNYLDIIGNKLRPNDFLINLAFNISSASVIELCNAKGALYMDTSTEPWGQAFFKKSALLADRTNYMLRENTLKLKGKVTKTAIMAHGANPGLASHFVKQALLAMAKDNDLTIEPPKTAADWAQLAKKLEIKAIHVAERDTQITNKPKLPGEFVNTWSVQALIDEGLQPAELGWGTHETHWPHDGHHHDVGSRCAIYLARPGAGTRVRSWSPGLGPFHGFLITHPETISLANYLTLKSDTGIDYRPTVHYAYCACPDAILSIHELLGTSEWKAQEHKRIIFNEIINGTDELGVLLMGNKKGAYWYGSTLTVEEARTIAPYNNATSLQVVAGVLSGMMWAIEHPNRGLVEAEDMDHEYIMNIAMPYLGKVAGYYTDWTPLQNREATFPEHLDLDDPWQFLNIRVD